MRTRAGPWIVVLSVGALVAWARDSGSPAAPPLEAGDAEVATSTGGDAPPLLLAYPHVTRRERPGIADTDAVPAPGGGGDVRRGPADPEDAAVRDASLPVEVLVLDAFGDPVAGAEVEVPRHRARTDAAGRARLPIWGYDLGSPSGDRYWKTVCVRAPGFVPVAHRGGGRREVIRVEDRGARVAGACVGPDGRPVAGVEVVLAWRQDRSALESRARTATDGRFAFDHAPLAWARLEVRGDAGRAESRPVAPPEEDVRLVLRPHDDEEAPPTRATYLSAREPSDPAPPPEPPLPSPPRPPPTSSATLRVRLVDGRRRPVTDGAVLVRWADGEASVAGASRPERGEPDDEDGTAPRAGEHVVHGVPPGTFDLVWRNGTSGRCVRLRRGLTMPDPAAPLDAGEILLPTPALLEVLVEDTVGPVPGAVVRQRSAGEEVVARTDRDGRCRVPVHDPSQVEVEAWHPDRGSARLTPPAEISSGRVRLFVGPSPGLPPR